MAGQNFRMPPPPINTEDKGVWSSWYIQVKDTVTRISNSFAWERIDFSGSNITDITIRKHDDLRNLQGGNATQQYHLTLTQHTDLTDAGNSTLHYHDSDRDSANFTGTNWVDLTDAGYTSLHIHWRSATATLDFGSIAARSVAELTVTVTGAATGDPVILGAPAAIETGLLWSGFASAADTVTIRLFNSTAAAVDPASASWSVRIVK